MDNKGFIVLPSYYEAVMMFEDEKLRLEAWDTLMSYGVTGVLPDNLNPMVKMLMISLKPTIDNTKKRYQASVENGKKGGRPPKTQMVNQVKPNQNLNKDKDKDKDKEKEKERDIEKERDTINSSIILGEKKSNNLDDYDLYLLKKKEEQDWRLKHNII